MNTGLHTGHRTVICFLLVLLKTASAVAQTVSPDSQMTLAMLTEVRQLRQDLQTATAAIQRVQIVMFRLQVQGGLLERAKQRLEQARFACTQAPIQEKQTKAEIERTETRKRSAQNTEQQRASEEMLSQLKSEVERIANEAQQCQVEQADAETQYRTEEAKMTAFRINWTGWIESWPAMAGSSASRWRSEPLVGISTGACNICF